MSDAEMTYREVTLVRVFDAPRDVVWRAWTEQLAAWWGPQGTSAPLSTQQLTKLAPHLASHAYEGGRR